MCVMRTALSVVLTVLAARAARPEHVDAEILLVDLDVDLLRLGQHRDGRRRGVDAPLRLGLRHALHAMHAGFELQPGEHPLAGDLGDDFLVAAGRRLACRDDGDLPAMGVGIALIHAEEIGREQRGLLAAGSGTDLEDGALLVGQVLGQQLHLKLTFELLDLGIERSDLLLGERRHVGLRCRIVDQMLKTLTLAERRAERVDRGHDGVELGEFPRESYIGLLIGAGGERVLHRLPSGHKPVELLGWNRCHVLTSSRLVAL